MTRASSALSLPVEDLVLRTEMASLMSQEEDAPRRIFWFKPMSWLVQIRPHRRDEVGLLVSGRHSLPLVSVLMYRPWRSYRSRLAAAGSFRLIRSGATSALVPPTRVPRRLTTGRLMQLLMQLLTSFAQTHKVKTQQVAKRRNQRCGDIELAGYLANVAGPVPLLLDPRIAHKRCEVALTLVLMDTYVTLTI